MTKTESAEHLVKTLAIESCEQWLAFHPAGGVRAAIPNTNNLIMVGPQEWIAKNVPGVEAMVEASEQPGDDQWIFDLAVDHESRGNGLYGPITFSSTALVDFVRAVITRLAATTQASTAQAERGSVAIVADWPFCNPGCDYEAPHGGREDCRNENCSCEPAKASIARQRANTATSSTDAQAAAEVRDAARDVLAERRRQVEAEGWTPEHDDAHNDGAMVVAAACYALQGDAVDAVPPEAWPWAMKWWKPSGTRRNLVKAAALILAEIERIDRAELRSAGDTGEQADGGAA